MAPFCIFSFFFQVQRSILKSLDATPMSDLPCFVKFILETIEPGTESDVIPELREKLELAPPAAVLDMLTQAKGKKKGKKGKKDAQDVDTMVMHVCKVSLSSSRAVANAWFRAIEGVRCAREHKTADVLVLLLLHALPTMRRPVESLLRNKGRKASRSGFSVEIKRTPRNVFAGEIVEVI